MKKYFILILMLMFSQSLTEVISQSIKLIRTDVDSARSNFVTATYMFGLDVVIEDVEKCNGVEFELTFNNIDYIHYSDWKVGGFGEDATTVVIPYVDSLTGTAKVYCLVISGDPIHEADVSDTTVIHLDFVVSQKAPHGRQVTFMFNNAHATVNKDSVGQVLNLVNEPFVYDIHGFVYVWPGDTDNNGIVDEVDMDKIALFLFHGATTKKMRSFKRDEPSTLWNAQRVLAWDSAEVTYADCDGDANITPFDMLVIPLNFAEQHSSIRNKKDKLESKFCNYEYKKDDNSISIPIYVNHKDNFIASTFQFNWQNRNDVEILGFDNGDLFRTENSFLHANLDRTKKEAVVVVGNYDKSEPAQESGVLFNIYVTPGTNLNALKSIIENAVAVSENRNFFEINYELLTLVDITINDSDDKNIFISQNDIEIIIRQNLNPKPEIKIYDILGNYVSGGIANNQIIHINKASLSKGIYIIVVKSNSLYYSETIFVY